MVRPSEGRVVSELQRLIEDYLLGHGWTGSTPVGRDAMSDRIWVDPKVPSSRFGVVAAVQRQIRREKGLSRGQWA